MNVFDFDDTIYDGESGLDMFFYFVRRDSSLLRSFPTVVKALTEYKKGNVTIEQALEKYAPFVEEYLGKNPGLLSDTTDFWDKHMKKIKSFYAEIQQPDDVVITASPEDTMREICARLGIKKYIGTKIDSDTGKITRLCMRENKVKAFFEEFPDGKIDTFYTDSAENDKPLIDISEKAYIVKGDKLIKIK